MSDGLLELLVLGKIPGQEIYINYTISVCIAATVVVGIATRIGFALYARSLTELRTDHNSSAQLDLITI
jgi:hypothetical protein